jgi:thiol-disulfide isomerase/thioredoxin
VRSDPPLFEEVTREIVSKVPASDVAAEALGTYAETLPQAEQITKLEEIVADYPPSKFRSAADAADRLFGFYDNTDPRKAADFAHKMLSEMSGDKEWKSKAKYVDEMAGAEAKIAANDGDGALALLKNVKVPGYTLDPTRVQLLKARAQDLAGNTSTAYADLLKIFAERPVRQVQPVLYQYGKKSGKSESSMDEEVWNARRASAKPATPFSLESFTDGKKVSLDDYKGKVVILDFWFPNCSPCMRAMPYLQNLWTKYKDAGLVFLGVNGIEGQADFVMPLVKSNNWGMIPLRGTEEWCSDVYNVRGFPSTFLIGADGRVYFRPDVYDSHQYAIAEMQIEALLARARTDKNSLRQ